MKSVPLIVIAFFLSDLVFSETSRAFDLFNVSADVSSGYDTNPTQSGSYKQVNDEPGGGAGGGGPGGGKGTGGGGAGGGGPGGGGPPGPGQGDSRFARSLTALPISGDQVLLTDLTLSKRIIDNDSVTFSFYANGSASFYNLQKEYNYESVNPYIKLSIYLEPWTFGTTASYLDTWYNTAHSQTYWSAAPFVEFNFAPKWTAYGEVGLTNATKEYYSVNINPYVSIRYDWTSEDGAYIGFSQYYANGERAVIGPPPSAGPRVVLSGSTFSNYTTSTVSAGVDKALPLKFFIKGYMALSRTSYMQEYVSQISSQPEPRTDSQVSWRLTLTRSIYKEIISAYASMSTTRNTSLGSKLGFLTQGTLPDYSYERYLYLGGISASF